MARNYGQPLVAPGSNAPTGGLASIARNSFFQYSITFVLAAGQNTQSVIPIQADAHFFCVFTTYDTTAMGGGAATSNLATGITSGGSLVQLSDTSAQRFLSNIQVPASSLFGTGQRPYVWPFTHIFRANGAIGVNVTDATAGGQTVRFVFSGYKIPIGSAPEAGL